MKKTSVLLNLFSALILYGISYSVFADNVIEYKDFRKTAEYSLGIILLGDSGENGPNQTKVAQAIEKYCSIELCNFGLLLGDNIYERGVTSLHDPQFKTKFENAFKKLKFKFYPVLGNHDVRGNVRAQVNYKSNHWEMAGRYYMIDTELAGFYALDTNLIIEQAEQKIADLESPQQKDKNKQLEWLIFKLAAKQHKWKIVYGHHPIYSSGHHGNTIELQNLLQPILESNQIDLYISGHDHDLELIQENDIFYIISGAGCKLRPIIPGNNSKFAASELGFVHLVINQQDAQIRFIDSAGKIIYLKYLTKS